MAAAANGDWFRSANWTPEIAEAFEAKLARARHSNRAQYLYIQGATLTAANDEQTREVGRSLLQRSVDDYPDNFHAKAASEQLGESLASEGRFLKRWRWQPKRHPRYPAIPT
jgi:hypothetical protein